MMSEEILPSQHTLIHLPHDQNQKGRGEAEIKPTFAVALVVAAAAAAAAVVAAAAAAATTVPPGTTANTALTSC
jgi:hypothetical protein